MSHNYELFNGPMDGATVTLPQPVDEGVIVDVRLTEECYSPDDHTVTSTETSTLALFEMRQGKLMFMGLHHSPLEPTNHDR